MKVLSRSTIPEATRTYQFITNMHALFHFWGKKNLLNPKKSLKNFMNMIVERGGAKTKAYEFVWEGMENYFICLCVHVTCAPTISMMQRCFDAT